MATAMASRDSSIAPRSDSSAWRLLGSERTEPLERCCGEASST